MTALEWFESIADERRRIDGIREQKALLESRLEPHGQALGATGHGGSSDKMFSLVLARMRLTDLQEFECKLPDMQRALEDRIGQALEVLYGKSGRGGLAKARSSTDADILCCYYLQGMGWAEIAREVVKPDTEWPRQWCRRRAMRALEFIDRTGIAKLANS